MVFLDESGFCLVPTVRKTWAPVGKTPILPIAGGWTKISAISAISVSAGKRRTALYIRFHPLKNIRHPQVLTFLRHLLRHLKRGFVLLWDRGSTHKAGAVKRFLHDNRLRIHDHFFPGYAPELNPAEFIWNNMKRFVSNSVPKDTDDLQKLLRSSSQRLKHSERLLRSCIRASELPRG